MVTNVIFVLRYLRGGTRPFPCRFQDIFLSFCCDGAAPVSVCEGAKLVRRLLQVGGVKDACAPTRLTSVVLAKDIIVILAAVRRTIPGPPSNPCSLARVTTSGPIGSIIKNNPPALL